MNDHTAIRARASGVARDLPGLILSAERLSRAVIPGAHGLRRSGQGDEFWQYRPAQIHESAGRIDWRRSARSDGQIVRDQERQRASDAVLFVSGAAGMDYAGQPGQETEAKSDHARILALALAIVLLRGEERVGIMDHPIRRGRAQIDNLAHDLCDGIEKDWPDPDLLRAGQRLVILGDFLGDLGPVDAFLAQAAYLGLQGVILQVLHPDEQDFPFEGAVTFQGYDASDPYDTQAAGALRAAYRARLQDRRTALEVLCQKAGWHFGHHDLSRPPAAALLWLYTSLAQG